MTTFGVDLGQHLTETAALVPHIVCKCIDEIDCRGRLIKVGKENNVGPTYLILNLEPHV
jgi:hypothetical protein